ncbi:hypothetical protein [Halomarina rubra]|uniref:Uncharacterized protein n=1 Tax=Halomarina rubra TaxID=2071873 RepID=A0ABD6ASB2_9EURY|nr:hypothetical protein [Halomarina rubra]
MGREHTYVCPTCGARITRSFRAPSVMRSCENGCSFGHFLRADVLERVDSVPVAARPDDWAELEVEERLLVAMREGVVSLPDLR